MEGAAKTEASLKPVLSRRPWGDQEGAFERTRPGHSSPAGARDPRDTPSLELVLVKRVRSVYEFVGQYT